MSISIRQLLQNGDVEGSILLVDTNPCLQLLNDALMSGAHWEDIETVCRHLIFEHDIKPDGNALFLAAQNGFANLMTIFMCKGASLREALTKAYETHQNEAFNLLLSKVIDFA